MRGFILLEKEKVETLLKTGYLSGSFAVQVGYLVKPKQSMQVPLNYHAGIPTTVRMLKTQSILNQMKWFDKQLLELEIPVDTRFQSADDAVTDNVDYALSGNNDYFVHCTKLNSNEVVSVIKGLEVGYQYNITINVLSYDKCPNFINDLVIGPSNKFMVNSNGRNIGLSDEILIEMRPRKCLEYNTLHAAVHYLVNSEGANEILEELGCTSGRVPNTYWSKTIEELARNKNVKIFS